jgi:hypothetical protein
VIVGCHFFTIFALPDARIARRRVRSKFPPHSAATIVKLPRGGILESDSRTTGKLPVRDNVFDPNTGISR